MLSDHLTSGSHKNRISKLFFLMVLAFFVLSPIVNAYSDSLCSPLVFVNGQHDSEDPIITDKLNLNNGLNCLHAMKASENAVPHYHALVQASAKCGQAYRIEEIHISANNVKSSHSCALVSSDLAPPVI